MLARVGDDRFTPDIEQGAQQHRPFCGSPFRQHTCGTRDTSTAQQIEEDGFGLIVTMVGQHEPVGFAIGEGRVPYPAGGCLQPFATVARNIDAYDFQRYRLRLTKFGTERRPCIGVLAQTVVYMYGTHFNCQIAAGGELSQRM